MIPMTLWRCLLLVYPHLEVRLPKGFCSAQRFVHELPPHEMEEAIDSFRCFPALVNDLTDHRAGVEHDIVTSERALTTLSRLKKGSWWPSPTDVQAEMAQHDVCSSYDSVFVFWPQNQFRAGTSVPSGGWGLGMGASDWSMGATYATVANAESFAWNIPLKGEVWLHEWLHGVCAHFTRQGHRMPDGDADGADRHGYVRSPTMGWTAYYQDLMNGRVLEDGQLVGISTAAWSESLTTRH